MTILPDQDFPSSPPFASANSVIRRMSTSHQLYEQLRERIIALQLPPALQLSRNELAEAYGVSQPPVRDALQVLENEGLVTVYPQSLTDGTRINLPNAREPH